jgi:hypothetical protein
VGERCCLGDEISVQAFIPIAADRQKVKLRRRVAIKIRRMPGWSDE